VTAEEKLLEIGRREAEGFYARDPWAWACDLVLTQDEADQTVKPFPRLEYVRELLELLRREPLVALPKSRRMFVSWLLPIWCVHASLG
jgi:hypothetical protein